MHLSEISKQTKTTASIRDISSGARGTNETLKLMRAIVRQSKKSMTVRALTLSLVKNLKQKDYFGELRAIHRYVRDNIRYVRDIKGVETIQTPEKTLEIGQGDCDDKSSLLASMLESIGHPTRLVALAFDNQPFCHVYVESKLGNKWIGVETTEPVQLGWTPPGTTRRMVIYN